MSEVKNLYQRLHAIMQAVGYIQKESKNNGLKYSFVSHDAVTGKIRTAMVTHGVVAFPVNMTYQQDGNRTEVSMNIRFVNVDDPNDTLEVPAFGFGIDQQDKGPGKAISYAVKYALLKTFMLETGDDADHNDQDHKPAKQAAPKREDPVREKARDVYAQIKGAPDLSTLAQVNNTHQDFIEKLGETHQEVQKQIKDLQKSQFQLLSNAPLEQEAVNA